MPNILNRGENLEQRIEQHESSEPESEIIKSSLGGGNWGNKESNNTTTYSKPSEWKLQDPLRNAIKEQEKKEKSAPRSYLSFNPNQKVIEYIDGKLAPEFRGSKKKTRNYSNNLRNISQDPEVKAMMREYERMENTLEYRRQRVRTIPKSTQRNSYNNIHEPNENCCDCHKPQSYRRQKLNFLPLGSRNTNVEYNPRERANVIYSPREKVKVRHNPRPKVRLIRRQYLSY